MRGHGWKDSVLRCGLELWTLLWLSRLVYFWCLALMPPQQPENLQTSGKKPLLKLVLGNTGLLQCMVPGRGTHAWLLHGATPMYGEAESQGKGKEGEGRVLHNQRFVCYFIKSSKQLQKAGSWRRLCNMPKVMHGDRTKCRPFC